MLLHRFALFSISVMRYILALISFIPIWLTAQTVENIHTHQNGSKIDIHYNITNSDASQKFKVTIFCYVNNESTIELQSVTGDVGKDVSGGKASYTATWDVLKDVESLTSASFTVRIEVIEKEVVVQNVKAEIKPLTNALKLVLNSSPIYTPFGLRLAYGADWGGYFGFRIGVNGYSQYGNEVTDKSLYSFTIGATKNIVYTNNFSLHAYAGGGLAQWGTYEYTETKTIAGNSDNGFQDIIVTTSVNGDADKGLEFEYGLMAILKRVVLTGGLAHNSAQNAFQTDFVLGIGVKF